MIRILLVALVSSLVVFVSSAKAEPSAELTQYLEHEVGSANNAVVNAGGSLNSAAPEDGWFFRRIFLRLRFGAGFTIPQLFTAKVIPEVEMMWEREIPDGWTSYKKN